MSILLFLDLGMGEIIFILFIILMLFGAESIPKFARTFGKVIFEFKNATKDIQDSIVDSAKEIKNQVDSEGGSIQNQFSKPFKQAYNDVEKSVNDTSSSVNKNLNTQKQSSSETASDSEEIKDGETPNK
jgi:sec-independent protein translocase protein TatA